MTISKTRRITIFKKLNGKCSYCGCDLDFQTFHIDHFIPRSNNGKGGDNLVPSCEDCNLYKGNLSIEQFREKIKNSIYTSIQGRILRKYFRLDELKVKFYFEEAGIDGYLQEHTPDLLE